MQPVLKRGASQSRSLNMLNVNVLAFYRVNYNNAYLLRQTCSSAHLRKVTVRRDKLISQVLTLGCVAAQDPGLDPVKELDLF